MEENTQDPTPSAEDSKMAEAVASALGAKNPVTVEGAEGEEAVEIQVDPTGRLVDPPKQGYHWGTGRRKESRARVRVRPGTGKFVVNGREINDFFCRMVDRNTVLSPLLTLKAHKKVDVFVKAEGGGITGQAGAVRMGLGRALCGLYPDADSTLRDAGHLSRDSRMVERKKYGRHGARRGHQWGKR